MKLTTLCVPLLLLAQGFTLIITQKNGEPISIDTENIEKIEFEGSGDGRIQLSQPVALVSSTSSTGATIKWSAVENATGYRQVLDNGEAVVNGNTSVTYDDLAAGEHTFSVTAVSSDSRYSDSPVETITFKIVDLTPAAPQMFKVKSSTANVITAEMNGVDEEYTVGVVPRSKEYIPDADLVAAVEQSPLRKEVKPSKMPQDIQFKDLEANTNYILVAYPKSGGGVARYYTRTYIDLTPGSKGIVWAPGVDMTSGFIDVDKVGDLGKYGWTLYVDENSLDVGDIPSNDDSGLCWACTASGMIQWWLNDYKNKTGHDYELRYPGAIPETSKCYSTPVMDMMNDAFAWNEGASCMDCIKWFFAGYYDHPVLGDPDDPRVCNTVGAPHRPDYQYWRGGFLGMDWKECMSYMVYNAEANDGFDWYNQDKFYNCAYTIPADATPEDTSKIFSKLNIDAFMEGPVYIAFAKHAMSAWGVEYEVDAEGTPIITNMYYCENTMHPSNIKNGYQVTPVEYKEAHFPYHLIGRNLVIVSNQIGGEYTLLSCSGLRGWQPK